MPQKTGFLEWCRVSQLGYGDLIVTSISDSSYAEANPAWQKTAADSGSLASGKRSQPWNYSDFLGSA